MKHTLELGEKSMAAYLNAITDPPEVIEQHNSVCEWHYGLTTGVSRSSHYYLIDGSKLIRKKDPYLICRGT